MPYQFINRGLKPSASVNYSTTFPNTESPLSDGGQWAKQGLRDGLLWTNINSGLASDGATHCAYPTQVPNNGFDDSIAHLSGFPANHYAQGTIYNDGGVVGLPEVELLLRSTIVNNSAIQYEIDILSDGRVFIVQWLGGLGSFNIEHAFDLTGVDVSNGTVIYAQIVGNIITLKRNGTTIQTADITTFANSPIATGNPGLGGYGNNGTADPNTQANRHFVFKAYSAASL